MFFASPFVATIVGRRRPRFRSADFLVRMWLLNAFRRRTFPVPVTEKRFFAPLWVFIFGITRSRCRALLRRENHGHRLPFHLRVALDLRDVRELGRHPVDDHPPELRVGDLSAAEHHGHLDLVPLLEEPAGVARLRLEVVLLDPRPVLHFLELDHVLLLLRLPRLLRLLELEFAVVHDADDRRARHRSDFNQIEILFLRGSERGLYVQNAHLAAVGGDHTERADANLPVHADALGRILNSSCSSRGKTETRTPDGIRAHARSPAPERRRLDYELLQHTST